MTVHTKARTRSLTKAKRLEEVKYFVVLCFMSLEEYDFKEVSNLTGLCLATIYRLSHGDFTLAVQYGTIQALGYAARLQLTHEENSVKVSLVN